MRDASTGDKELHRVFNPQSSILDPVILERVRWRCRRGLLELDIVLGRFIEQYASLGEQQKLEFDILLDMPDTVLWDMISGKQPAANEEQQALLALINAA
jgi:antitoxin CptB